MSGDARPAGGGWVLRTICAIGALAMATAGAYLFEPSLVDLGLYVERGKHALAGYTLIYAALLVGFAATAGQLRTGSALADYAISLTVGTIALLALGLLFSALAADALFFRDPRSYWVALLAIPAALCFAAASLSDTLGTGDGSQAADGAQRGFLAGFAIVAGYFMISLAAIMLYINAGYFLFYLLQASLLDGRDLDLARAGPALLNVLGGIAVERWRFVIIVGFAGAVLIYGFTALASVAGRSSRRTEQRALEPQETAYIEQCAQDLRAYAEAKGYSRDATRVLRFVVLPSLFVPLLLASIAGFNLHNWFPRPYDQATLDALGWHIHESSVGPSALVMLFAGIFWSVFPNAIAARVSRSYSEMAGWSGFVSKNAPMTVEAYLTLLLRAGRLSPKVVFDPGKFLHATNTAWEPFFMYPALALTFAAAIAWHHDMSRYHLLTEKNVEVMSYWTLEKHRYPYREVREVRIKCYFDDGNPEASYEIILPDDFSADLFDKKNFADHADDLARVDALIPASVPRVLVTYEEQSLYDPVCVDAIAADLPEEAADRLRAAFRTEAWQKARWEERTSPPK
jgi:hypothetical protein